MGIYTAKNLIWQFCGCLCSLQKSYNKLQVNIFNISFYKKITAWQRQGLCTTKIKCNSFSFTYVQHVTTILQWNLSWEAIAMRLPVLTDHTFLAGRPTFQCNWTCQQRPHVDKSHFCCQWGSLSGQVLLSVQWYLNFCPSHCCFTSCYFFMRMRLEFSGLVHSKFSSEPQLLADS